MRLRIRVCFPLLLICALLPVGAQAAVAEQRIDDVVRVLRAPLMSSARLRLENVPLDGLRETLELERFEVWDPQATIVADNGSSLTNVARPATRFFRGHIVGDPESLVFLAVDEGVTGFVTSTSRRYDVRSRVKRLHGKPAEVETYIQETTDLAELPPDGQSFLCGTEGDAIHVPEDAGLLKPSAMAKLIPFPTGTLGTGTALRSLTLAIEVDSQLFVNLGSSTGNVNLFLGNLIGAASTIYQRDLRTELTIVFSRIQTSSGSDPFIYPGTSGTWNGSPTTFGTSHALAQLGDLWNPPNTPPFSGRKSAVVRLSGSTTLAGIAWINTLCGNDFQCSGGACGSALFDSHFGGKFAYCGGLTASTGISTTVPNPDAFVNGVQFELPSTNFWSLLEFTHELGHVVAAIHTHCEPLTPTEQANYGL